jgi:hypothetical protein
MVNSCANPSCRKTLRYLRDGVVYLFAAQRHAHGENSPHTQEHFWLCGACAEHWTLRPDASNQVQLIRKPRRKTPLPPTSESHPPLPMAI